MSASGQGADDHYAATGQPGESTTTGGPTGDPNSTGSQGGSASSGGGDSSSTAGSEGAAPPLDDSRLNEPLRAERRKSNQLEKEIRTLRQQLNRFSEITCPLRGLEGSAAALYFRSLGGLLEPDGFGFAAQTSAAAHAV